MPTKNGALRIFTLAGIGVYVHWMWLLAAVYSIQYRAHVYSSLVWNVIEYLSLFAIVLTHEFGHQLACRSVGGKTHDIILWLLGGVAYVSPPPRPGAQLWSIAAGPLVNVALIPVFSVLVLVSSHLGWSDIHPDADQYLHNLWWINVVLLIFNMMPVYPLDGGQILRSLLWFPFGRANSLMIASIIGFIGVAGLILLAIGLQSLWLGIMAAFILMNCWGGLRQAWALARIAKIPRRDGFACPACHAAPPLGELWRCGKCGKAFDTFLTQATCPHCGTQYNATQCLDCGNSAPFVDWTGPGTPPSGGKNLRN
jgi:Zn-dependent protease/DNA-directed RNA polymerase subunit RPC12/RpoP